VIVHVVESGVIPPHALLLAFDDGTRKCVDLGPLLDGPIFEPLRDPVYFARAVLDPVLGTVVWPNGADFAPEALHALPGLPEPEATTVRAAS